MTTSLGASHPHRAGIARDCIPKIRAELEAGEENRFQGGVVVIDDLDNGPIACCECEADATLARFIGN
jgi:hypothetical protein